MGRPSLTIGTRLDIPISFSKAGAQPSSPFFFVLPLFSTFYGKVKVSLFVCFSLRIRATPLAQCHLATFLDSVTALRESGKVAIARLSRHRGNLKSPRCGCAERVVSICEKKQITPALGHVYRCAEAGLVFLIVFFLELTWGRILDKRLQDYICKFRNVHRYRKGSWTLLLLILLA